MTASHTTTPDLPHEIAHAAEELAEAIERALQLPEPATSWWHRPGVSPRGERLLEAATSLVLGLVACTWVWTIAHERQVAHGSIDRGEPAAVVTPTTRAVTAALTRSGAPSAAFLAQSAVERLASLRGESGKVRLVLRQPGEAVAPTLPAGAAVSLDSGRSAATATPPTAGIRSLAVRVGEVVRPVADLHVVTLTPLSRRRAGRIGPYYIGRWPTEGRTRAVGPGGGDYAAPRGLIEVTPENQDTRLSEHLRLRDFLTHDQQRVWPKYVVVQPRIVDKLELVLDDLRRRGYRGQRIHVMSGFRTPQYNTGGGDPRGRANLSRHMYGDAADIWIDDDGDGRMDDLDRDGRHDIGDAQVVCAAVERVEARYPELVGGCGIYPGNGAHGPFVHVDARGYRARWTGSGDGA